MNNVLLEKIITIKNKKGDIKKLINKNDTNYFGFGELYLTYCNFDEVKAWKKHKKMFSNLIILKGKMKIVIHNENYQNENSSKYNEYILSEKKMSKLTIPPNLWFGFKGLNKTSNCILNFANMIHEDREVLTKKINRFDYDWNKF